MELTTVYQYFASNGALIYVGITNRGTRRLHEHADSKPWWGLATGCTLEHFPARDAALEREAYLISTFRPPFNTQHNPERTIPVSERAQLRLRAEVLGRKQVGDDTLKERRREWLRLSGPERLIAPCISCAQRPGVTGPECIPCRQARQARNGDRGTLASDHRRLHRSLNRGDTCPECGQVMTHRPPARSGSATKREIDRERSPSALTA